MLGSITADQVYLELTFVTLAMLVVGGVTSLWGAVVGALAVSGLDSFLGEAEQGVGVGFTIDLPQGARLVIVGTLMALVLILRPSGHHRRARVLAAAARAAGRGATRKELHEGLRGRLRCGRARCSRRTSPRSTTSRCGRSI